MGKIILLIVICAFVIAIVYVLGSDKPKKVVKEPYYDAKESTIDALIASFEEKLKNTEDVSLEGLEKATADRHYYTDQLEKLKKVKEKLSK